MRKIITTVVLCGMLASPAFGRFNGFNGKDLVRHIEAIRSMSQGLSAIQTDGTGFVRIIKIARSYSQAYSEFSTRYLNGLPNDIIKASTYHDLAELGHISKEDLNKIGKLGVAQIEWINDLTDEKVKAMEGLTYSEISALSYLSLSSNQVAALKAVDVDGLEQEKIAVLKTVTPLDLEALETIDYIHHSAN